MKLSFYGATHEVTGSCFYLEACGKNILIDCGMKQGIGQYENQELPIPTSQIDCVFLTHAHIDHSGNLPLLYSKGFKGNIHATSATAALCDIMLKDSAHIQEFEAEWKNRKAKRANGNLSIPAYTMEDAIETIKLFKSYEYNTKIKIYEGIEIRFVDAGHLLGSSSIEVWVTENNITKKIVFSGDIGNIDQPLIDDPQYITDTDFVVMESTYGNRNHGERPDYVKFLTKTIQETFDKGGNVVIPSFAIGRTQEMLYFIRQIKEENLIKGHPNFPVYVDSPLAIEATSIFNEKTKGYYDQEAMNLINRGINPISFPGLVSTLTSDESRQINFDNTPKVILSASGMCDAGRIRHHLKHNLWRKESTILFVGYQAAGTLGRMILDGIKQVKLFGEQIQINANILFFEGVSGHADKDGLIKWLQSFEKKPQHVFVVHGQSEVCDEFSELLKTDYGYSSSAPYSGEQYDLEKNILLRQGSLEKATKKPIQQDYHQSSKFPNLQKAGERLMAIILSNRESSNKEIVKLTNQINSLCDKTENNFQ